jgi:hypothetical protein
MGAYYDKYDPKAGGFRAALAADMTKTSAGNPVGVGLNSSGQVVPGAGTTGVVGVIVLTKDKKAGDIVDVMTAGECVGCAAPLTAGTAITADTTSGALGVSAASATKTPIGFCAEATRLVVRRNVQPYIGT